MANHQIEKLVVLKAPRSRVWQALTESEQFGEWFGAKISGPFIPGGIATGTFPSKQYAHLTMEIQIERMEPETYLSWRWHPYAVDPSIDYSTEPTTLVEFTLAETPEGTLLKVVESGFDGIPPTRRPEAFRRNEGGWEAQLRNIGNYVEKG